MNSKKNSKYINDGERLYEFTQKVFKLLTEIGNNRKKSKEDWNNEVITRNQHHRNITSLYVKAVSGMEGIVRWELASIVTDGIMTIFQETESMLFDKLTLQKGKELADAFKPVAEQSNLEKKELKQNNSNLATHKPFANLDKKLEVQQ